MDLMLALFDGDGKHRRTVTFLVNYSDNGTPVPYLGVIDKVERVLGSDKNWNFEGRLYHKRSRLGTPCQGLYSTDLRRGWVHF